MKRKMIDKKKVNDIPYSFSEKCSCEDGKNN